MLRVKPIDAEIYHYGWVRPPSTMIEKRIAFNTLYHNDEELKRKGESFETSYDDLGNLKRFTETHPQVMKARIETSNWPFDPSLHHRGTPHF